MAGTEDAAWIEAEREHERQMRIIENTRADNERRHAERLAAERTERVQAWVVGLAVVASILGIVFAIWSYADRQGVRDAEIEVACIEAGGTWVTVGRVPMCTRVETVEGVEVAE